MLKGVPISLYVAGFMAVALVPALFLAYFYLDKAYAIQASAAEQAQGQAYAELKQAIVRESGEIADVARNLAGWDETRAQLDDPTYYAYWKQSRVRDAGRFQTVVDSVELFDAKSRALAPETAFGKQVVTAAIRQPMLVREGERAFIVYFEPISVVDGARERVVGYVGVRGDIGSLLRTRHAFRYSDAGAVTWDVPDREPIGLGEGVAQARLSVKQNEDVAAFVDLVHRSFRQYLVYIVLTLASMALLLVLSIARPLQRLVKYIHEVNANKRQEIPEDFQAGIRIAELQQLRDALHDYRDRFRTATATLVEKNEELMVLTYRDTLTGAYNRRAFEMHLQQALDTAQAGHRQHALCYIDLDQFKVVNDTCGHMAGDELLKQVAARLQSHVRGADTVARLGGDEFAVLLEGCPLNKAAEIAEQLRQSLKTFRFSWEEKLFDVSGSIGVVPVNAESGTLFDILRAADSACYVAKDLGRNRVHVYQPDDKELVQRYGEMQWVTRITKAFEDNRFELYCQRIIPVHDSALSEHVEILIRMRDEDGEIVPPMAFLPAAERYSLMPTLDRWVVRTALQALGAGAFTVDGAPRAIAINLSGQSLGDDHFLEFVTDILAQPGVDPALINFEITETAAITNLVAATRFISALRALGCRFSLDDFGSGLSSFNYLKNLKVDHLKIDGHFVKNLVDDPISYSMVEAINQIGHVMGIKTIAEFVENDAILRKLEEIGVDYAQGYGIGRPVPLSALRDAPVVVTAAR
jgi:diguanylate cyclase (GGDEF)-like protein